MVDIQLKSLPIALTGRLITSVDGTQLGEGDLQSLSNMRYTDKGIKSIKGCTKINTSPPAKPTIKAAFHFVKDKPVSESHLLIQGQDSVPSSALYDNTTAIPNQGNFTLLKSETSTSNTGKFSSAPDGCIAYGNGQDLWVWGGNESRCAGFIVADKDDFVFGFPTILYDYTSSVIDFDITTAAIIKQKFVFVAATRALQGVKFYVGTANTSAATVNAYYYNISGDWVSIPGLSDGTSISGKTLAQTGTVSFNNTSGLAELRYFNNTLAFWYLFNFSYTGAVDNTTTVTTCTVNSAPQQIANIWDGVPRTISACIKDYYGTEQDVSVNALQTDFVDGVTSTYFLYNSNECSYILIGFTERMRGIFFTLAEPYVNGQAATMAVSYWNGSSWIALLGVNDKTVTGSATLAHGGIVYWTPPPSDIEFKTSSTITKDLFYYYKFTFTVPVGAAAAFIDQVTGIPVGSKLDIYRFPTMFQNRLVLCNNLSSESNTVLIGGANSSCVFNGTDSTKLYFGDDREIVAAVPFFSRFSNNFYENLLVCKSDSVWIVDGNSPDTYITYKIASMYGCAAPGTMTACDLGFTQSAGTTATRNVVIWQSSSSIVMFDGSTVFPISFDIDDVFDQANSYAIDLTMMSKSTAFYDEVLREWHWCWASKGNTTLNKEYVFDIIRKKWYSISRGSVPLQLGVSVIDTNNNRYSYGVTTTGFLERLENGTTFDGTSITASFQTGDIPISGWGNTSIVRKVRPIIKAKNTTTNTLQIDYYADTGTTAVWTKQFNVGDTTHRIVKTQTNKPNVESISEGDYTFHSFKGTMTTSDENIPMEPIGILVQHQEIRQVVK